MSRYKLPLAVTVLCIAATTSSVGCEDVGCPPGTTEIDEHCVKTSSEVAAGGEAVAGTAGTLPSPNNGGSPAQPGAGLGGSPGSSPAAGTHGGSMPTPSAGSGSETTPSNSGAAGAFGTMGGISGTAGSAVHTAGNGAAGDSGSEDARPDMGPCAGHAGEAVCEGATLHHCDGTGTSSPETCTSAMLCQVGLVSGACAVCSPGTFRCTGVQLERCNDAGQYEPGETCASAALCNENAGMCTEMVCNPNAKSCSADGTLRTCNADGSAFVGPGEACGRDMCDARSLRCMKCVPSPNTCSGDTVTGCSSDGQTITMTRCSGATPRCANGRCVACNSSSDCTARDECLEPTCNVSTHTCGSGTPKPAKTSCGGGKKVCDGAGKCTTCGNGTLDAGESCETAGPYAYAPGTCDAATCVMTDNAYSACADTGMAVTLCPINPSTWFCAPHGSCSKPCLTDTDCKTTSGRGRCTPFGTDANYCVVDCDRSCPAGQRCVDVSGFGLGMLCGTVPRPAM